MQPFNKVCSMWFKTKPYDFWWCCNSCCCGDVFCTQDEELQMIIDGAREMENSHGHLFDFVIVNQDLNHAYDELLKEINRLELEPQWVPTSWIT